jgi:hypothetical protein
MADKRDLIDDLTHTIKEHPIESLAAYELLVPKEKKKEIEETAIGLGVIMVALILVIPLLFAPAMESFISDKLRRKIWENGATVTVEEIAKVDRQLVFIRVWLWIVAIVSWTVLLVVLFLANDSPYGH